MWWPLLLVVTLVLMGVGAQAMREGMLFAIGVMFDPWLFDRVDRYRKWMTVDAAIELAAEQADVDGEELACAHFTHCINRQWCADSEQAPEKQEH